MQSFKLKFLLVAIVHGVEFPIFLLIYAWALQQCSANALPVTSQNQTRSSYCFRRTMCTRSHTKISPEFMSQPTSQWPSTADVSVSTNSEIWVTETMPPWSR